MKPSDLPFSDTANEQLRTELASAITRAEIASSKGSVANAQKLYNQLNAALNALSPSVVFPDPPSPVEASSIVITPTDTGFSVTWDPAVEAEGGFSVSNYSISVYEGSATSGIPVLASGLIGTGTEWSTDDLANPVALDPETTYNLRIQMSYWDSIFQFENSGGNTYKQFTTLAAE